MSATHTDSYEVEERNYILERLAVSTKRDGTIYTIFMDAHRIRWLIQVLENHAESKLDPRAAIIKILKSGRNVGEVPE